VSFSSVVKNELCRIDVKNSCCCLSELAAVIRLGGAVKCSGFNDVNVKITTENPAFARRTYSLLKKIYGVNAEVVIRRSRKLKKHVTYILVVTSSMGAAKLLKDAGVTAEFEKNKQNIGYLKYYDENFKNKDCCKRAYLRGAFLAAGSVSDPEKTYHLEISSCNKLLANELCGCMNSFGLNSKIIRRKGSFITYLKEGENIVDFLNIIGAHSALLELENIRILKEMRNNVNRIVNCETANLEKTVNASVRQVENIKYIRDTVGLDVLSPGLREIAELRLKYNDANLKELGEKLIPPLGKSGVNHRLRKLDEIAEEIKKRRESDRCERQELDYQVFQKKK